MSLFGLIKRSKPAVSPVLATRVMRQLPVDAPPPVPPAPTPSDVRHLLFDAVARGDEARLARLCEEHRDVVREHASHWLAVPDELRANPAAAEWYTRGVRLLAQFCTPTAA